eukprot:COSAG01_NODE_24254_length_785_cov_1.061224_3_plen_51_part_01
MSGQVRFVCAAMVKKAADISAVAIAVSTKANTTRAAYHRFTERTHRARVSV